MTQSTLQKEINEGKKVAGEATEGPWDYSEREIDGILHTFISARPSGRVINKGTLVPRSDLVKFYTSNSKHIAHFSPPRAKAWAECLEIMWEALEFYADLKNEDTILRWLEEHMDTINTPENQLEHTARTALAKANELVGSLE